MSEHYKIKARLAYPYVAAPEASYRKLLDSATVLNPFRKNYISERMVHDLQGIRIRR